jgi:hypothetical protein
MLWMMGMDHGVRRVLSSAPLQLGVTRSVVAYGNETHI